MVEIEKKRPYVIWLEDVLEEIELDLLHLKEYGIEVEVAQGFRQLDGLFKAARQTGRSPDAIILDIMIAHVENLSAFFSQIKNGNTAHGYSAGLVFLERGLEAGELFPELKLVPVVLNSKRALSYQESQRLRTLMEQSGRTVKVLEKVGNGSLCKEVALLLGETK